MLVKPPEDKLKTRPNPSLINNNDLEKKSNRTKTGTDRMIGTWDLKRWLSLGLTLSIVVEYVSGLECYVCHDQDGNAAKCLKTIKTCEYEEDHCMSTIRWSTEPYWSQGAEKQYYVSKRCATEEECFREINGNMPLCHYIWYEDWKCAECCQGDRCNYYVTLSGNIHLPHSSIFLLSLMISYLAFNQIS